MRKLFGFLFAVMLGGGGVWFSYNYHLVRTEKEWLVVSRQRTALTDVFCDVRAWTVTDWKQHSDLASDLVKHGRGDLVLDTSARGLLDELMKPFTSSPRVGRSNEPEPAW